MEVIRDLMKSYTNDDHECPLHVILVTENVKNKYTYVTYETKNNDQKSFKPVLYSICKQSVLLH